MILDYFPAKLDPRPEQIKALIEIERLWSSKDVIVLNAPTAFGKSPVAYTLAAWLWGQKKTTTTIITPSQILNEQYVSMFPELPTMRAKDWDGYECLTPVAPTGRKRKPQPCGECSACRKKNSEYFLQRQIPFGVVNYWTYWSNRLYREVLIVDEAHKLHQEIFEQLGQFKLYHRQYKFPLDLSSLEDLLAWAEEQPPNPKIRKVIDAVKRYELSALPYLTREEGSAVLKFLPLDARASPPYLWPPGKVRKLVLMSATISPQDIYDFGLDKRSVGYIYCESPIPVDRRPVVFNPIADMSSSRQQDSVEDIAQALEQLADQYPDSGLVHATYAVASQLEELIDNPRFMWHNRDNKEQVYEEFRKRPGAVLVASGLHEGVDLLGDVGRWQVVTQVPWPYLGDKAVAYKCRSQPTWYGWQAVKSILQACGRISRDPSDYGATLILDSQFERLYRDYNELFPAWFKAALRS